MSIEKAINELAGAIRELTAALEPAKAKPAPAKAEPAPAEPKPAKSKPAEPKPAKPEPKAKPEPAKAAPAKAAPDTEYADVQDAVISAVDRAGREAVVALFADKYGVANAKGVDKERWPELIGDLNSLGESDE